MAYQFDFVPVLANTDLLLRGALFTLEIPLVLYRKETPAVANAPVLP